MTIIERVLKPLEAKVRSISRRKRYNFKLNSEFPHYASDLKEAMTVAAIDLLDSHAILINSRVFVEDPSFSHLLVNFFNTLGYSSNEESNKGMHFKFFLIMDNAKSIEEAKGKAMNFSNILKYNPNFPQLDFRFFAAILNETTPQEIIDKILTEYFCRPSIVIGTEEWVVTYLNSPELVDSALGVLVNISPDSSEFYYSASNAFMASVIADLKSGVVPPDMCAELAVLQDGRLIWAPKRSIPSDLQDFLNHGDCLFRYHLRLRRLRLRLHRLGKKISETKKRTSINLRSMVPLTNFVLS